ncbi:MAG TPA: glycosyltransferase [Luteolibacter sp.]|nr:glycosyltransferase [Luteolibacter sp.]
MKVLIYDQHVSGHNPAWMYAMTLAALRRGCRPLVALRDAPQVNDWFGRLSEPGFERIAIEDLGDARKQLCSALQLAHERQCHKLIFPYMDFMLGAISGAAPLLEAGSLDLGGIVLRPLLACDGSGRRLKLAMLKCLRTSKAKMERRRLRGAIKEGYGRDILKAHVGRGNDLAMMSLDCDEHERVLGCSYPFARLGRLGVDPWLSRSHLTRAEARTKIGLPQERFIFLHCGTDDEVKGLGDAMQAWDLLPPAIRARSLLLRAGRVRNTALRERINSSGTLIDRYIEQELLDDLYAACDCVLMPYRHHSGTSGVLIHAAAARRPVIAPDHSVVGRLVAAHDLGRLFRHLDVADLARAMQQACEVPAEPGQRASDFAQANSLDAFCEQLGDFFFGSSPECRRR